MNLTQRNPWSVFNQLDRQFNGLLRQIDNPGSNDDSAVVTGRWLPAVDIREEENQFLIQADLPGIEPKDVEITMDKNVLTLKGERHQETEEGKNGYRRVERTYGTFYRRFSLPETADAERIQARSDNGVLTISIPKQEKAQPRRITVGA